VSQIVRSRWANRTLTRSVGYRSESQTDLV
jgi:hypothetical protein